eukprot:TRINITY_DN3779_c0_g1_i1.p1 TRINITY_DN3779_c0_g1~~TRINITY_DN3779_c0_g1_i1.p1  ORF type:complete len:745 (+),score=163.09 TRINITY_DN3779_c0_g1_i1:333-2567(+)
MGRDSISVPSKEAVVVILDVGKSMSTPRVLTQASQSQSTTNTTTPLEGAIKAVTLLVQQKILYSPKDEIGLITFGTQDTNNPLMDQGYQHVTCVRDIVQPDVNLLRKIEEISPGNQTADLMDALIVGMDMLIRKTTGKRYLKRIFLVTDAGSPILLSDDERKQLVQQFERMEAKLNVIGIDFFEEEEKRSENETFVREFTAEVEGVVVPVHQALQLMSYFRGKSVLQRSAFRGCLEVSPLMKIGVWSFVKTMEQKFPAMKKLSGVSQQSANPGTMVVKMERSYYSLADPDTEILFQDLVKGFRYGKGVVPFTDIDEKGLKYTAEKCLKVIGFTDAKSIPRHHMLSSSEVIVPEPGEKNAAMALSALIHALSETESVAVARFVKREGGGPKLVLLSPLIKKEHEFLVLSYLPFSEDLRLYQFTPLLPSDTVDNKRFLPSQEQLDAAQNLIDSLDLTTAAEDENGNVEEALKPRQTYNPVLQHHYQCLQFRALHPNAPLPPLDPILASYINPDASLFEKAAPAIEKFQSVFPLKRTEQAENKLRRKFWGSKAVEDQEIRLESYVPDLAGKKRKIASNVNGDDGLSLDKLVSDGVNDVGSVNPVQDFKSMLERRDVDLVDKAITQMKHRILQLINDSIKTQFYQKAYDCLIVLREGCIKESESDQFNQFMQELKSYYMGKRRDDFWVSFVVHKKVSLIHCDESDDSPVTPEESTAFLSSTDIPLTPPDTSTKKDEGDEVDDLLDQIE